VHVNALTALRTGPDLELRAVDIVELILINLNARRRFQ